MDKRSSKKLTQNELVKVLRHLDNNRSVVEGYAKPELIEFVKNGAGIEMTRGNVEGIARIEGYEWVAPPRKTNLSAATRNERILGQALIDIYAKLGEEAPEELTALTEG